MMLHATGNISKYINMKYSYLTFTMIFVMGFLTIYQLVRWARGDKHEDIEPDDHDHSHDENSVIKKIFVYGMLLIPIITGIFFPIATLDSTIVKAKGFHFSMIDNDTDQYANHQILRPNSSLYYDSNVYNDMEKADLKKYGSKGKIVLDDDNYFRALETIYNYPGNFIDKTISLNGFVYHSKDVKDNQLFLFRFGIIHCLADAGVYGMMVEFPKDMKLKEDQWIKLDGTLSTTFYQPFQQNIPYLKVTNWKKISQPKEPYAYRKYQ
jgi:putative membrane protein